MPGFSDLLQGGADYRVAKIHPGGVKVCNDRTGRREQSTALGTEHNAQRADKRHAKRASGRTGSSSIEHGDEGSKLQGKSLYGCFPRTQAPFKQGIRHLNGRLPLSPTAA